jgi:hypothetical protein
MTDKLREEYWEEHAAAMAAGARDVNEASDVAIARMVARARAEALEEAAKCAEELRHPNYSAETDDWLAGTVFAAFAIQALKERP